ncbi:DoxX family protein [Halococcus salifodinae]|uniref:DoxX family membrane protein n=1 Tax=Halococcus salifodinae DSM 8989 TaxID=1227456 RepID=M0MVL6_9EURY|nr:DoxX family membrane protein [Halococcus salifodinae]EMA49792.1 hypothetical protein C450_15995 [Halococcus salifodinae DSM 8989]
MSTDTDDTPPRLKRPLLYVMGVFYAAAGVMHFVAPKVYARIVPPRFPKPAALVYLSGIAEIVLGIGVLLRRTRQRSAWGLIALLIAVFPANVHMATSDVATDAAPDWAEGITRAAMWARLPLQGVLILWAWWYTRLMPESSEKDASNPETHQ